MAFWNKKSIEELEQKAKEAERIQKEQEASIASYDATKLKNEYEQMQARGVWQTTSPGSGMGGVIGGLSNPYFNSRSPSSTRPTWTSPPVVGVSDMPSVMDQSIQHHLKDIRTCFEFYLNNHTFTEDQLIEALAEKTTSIVNLLKEYKNLP